MTQTVTLNGRTYAVDYGSQQYQRRSIELLRRQSDQGARPGSQSLNPEGPWRRTSESWHRGEGQTHYDREDSDPFRYDTSFGVDPWDKYTLRLLPDTMRIYTATSEVADTVIVGPRLYIADGSALKYTEDDGQSWTTVVGTSGSTIINLATDGFYVYIATGGGLYVVGTGPGDIAGAVVGAPSVSRVFYAKGRLLTVSADGKTLNYLAGVAGSGGTSVLATLPGGRWVDATAGNGFIYVASTSQGDPLNEGTGDGTIHRIGILEDGTGLDVPVIAASLPVGEDAFSVYGYLGFLLIGTSRGVRFAAENGDGSLTLGALRQLSDGTQVLPIREFTAEDRFVYYGQPSINGSVAGLTRLDLAEFVAPLTPAAAADLRTPAGTFGTSTTVLINSCGTYLNRQYFTTNTTGGVQSGIWLVANTTVGSGELTSGIIDYGLAEAKLPLYLDLQTEPLPASTAVEISVAVDGSSTYTVVGTYDTDGATSFTANLSTLPANEFRSFRIKLRLTGGGSTTPVVNRVTLRAYPVANRGETIQLPVLLGEELELDGQVVLTDVSAEVAALKALTASKQLVTLTEGDTSTQVYVEDYDFRVFGRDNDASDLRGTAILKLKSFG